MSPFPHVVRRRQRQQATAFKQAMPGDALFQHNGRTTPVFPVRKAINQGVGSGNGTAVVCLMRSIANRDVTSASVIPSTSRL